MKNFIINIYCVMRMSSEETIKADDDDDEDEEDDFGHTVHGLLYFGETKV